MCFCGVGQILVEWPVTLLRYMTTPLLDGAWGHKRRVLACIWPVRYMPGTFIHFQIQSLIALLPPLLLPRLPRVRLRCWVS